MMAEIEKLEMLTALPPDVKSRLLAAASLKTYLPGESIFSQGDQPTAFYIVVSGRVKVSRVTPEGYENILCVRREGEHFCPVPILDGGEHLGTAFAMTDVTLLWIDHDDFYALCRQSPELLSLVQGDCLAEVRRLLQRFEVVAFRSIRERVAHTLLAMSQAESSQTETLHLTHQELGALVGASRESVSRALNELERRGIVRLERGRVTILSADRLQRIARSSQK